MTKSHPLFDFTNLSPAERILLAEELWDSVRPHAEALPRTADQKQELERRWKEFETGKTPVSRWSEVKHRLLES